MKITTLSPELQAVAITELNEVPARIPQDLEQLKLWISQQPHLKVRNDDKFLLQFLRGSKYSLEKAKERIDLYYTLKTKYPELFQNTDIETSLMKNEFQTGEFLTLPIPLFDCGPRIIVYRFNYTLPENNFMDMYRHFAAITELILYTDPYACIYGLVYIFDMAELKVCHMRTMTAGFFKKIFSFYAKTMPLRIKACYFINSSFIAMQMYRLILPLISEKIRQRVCICGKDITELTTHVPLKYLPEDYGGENGRLDELAKDVYNNLKANVEYFKEDIDCGVDETLRPGKPIDFDGIYGMDGSFRKFEVD